MDDPNPNGSNGTPGRSSLGQFLPGNQAAAGHGNPHADRVSAWRRTLSETVTEDDLRAVIAMLVERARAGERWAVRELLDRCLGKVTQEVHPAAAERPEHMVLKLKFDEPRRQLTATPDSSVD